MPKVWSIVRPDICRPVEAYTPVVGGLVVTSLADAPQFQVLQVASGLAVSPPLPSVEAVKIELAALTAGMDWSSPPKEAHFEALRARYPEWVLPMSSGEAIANATRYYNEARALVEKLGPADQQQEVLADLWG